jgi:hypothetical protein
MLAFHLTRTLLFHPEKPVGECWADPAFLAVFLRVILRVILCVDNAPFLC